MGVRAATVGSALTYNSDDFTPHERNEYPQWNFPPAAVWQSASDFVRVNKFQQFHREIFVNHELTDKRVRDDHFQFPFLTA